MTQSRTRIQRTCMTVTPEVQQQRRWVLVDAAGQVLGRLASRVAAVLRGKHSPHYSPQSDAGDYVIVINAEQVRVTGSKLRSKTYRRYTGYPGGLRQRTLEEQLAQDPRVVVQHAVKGMLPKNRLGRQQLRKLHVYPGAEHPHHAQQPLVMTVGESST